MFTIRRMSLFSQIMTVEVCIPVKNNRAPSYEKIKREKERKKNSIDMMKIGSLTHDRKLLRMTRNRHWVTQTTLPASEARNSFFPIPHFCSSVPRLRLIQSSDIVGGCSRLIRDEEIEIWWEFWSLSFITLFLYYGIVGKKINDWSLTRVQFLGHWDKI